VGQQQLLLSILGLLIVAIAIAAGIAAMSTNNVLSNRDSIISDINLISSEAYAYRSKPSAVGGGSGSYLGYRISSALRSTGNATYTVTAAANSVIIVANSREYTGNSITAVVDAQGRPGAWTFKGVFE
jgi:hypothetical protein